MRLFFIFLLSLLLAQCQVQVGGLPFWTSDDDQVSQSPTEEEILHIREQLAMIKCPARVDLGLADYFNCLWRSSVNADDLREREQEQEKEYKMKTNQNVVKEDPPSSSQSSGGKRSQGTADSGPKSRKKRAATDRYNYNFTRDLENDLIYNVRSRRARETYLPFCQAHEIRPGNPLSAFVYCLRRVAKLVQPTDPQYPGEGRSLDPIYNPPTRRPIIDTYDQREMPILANLSNDWINWPGNLSFKFTRLRKEDIIDQTGFGGADPYGTEQFSEYRYSYSNLDTNQRQPGWSFEGASGPALWHELDINKFYTPLVSGTKVKEMESEADFAQAYPGLGELAEHYGRIKAPLDYRWTKDSGYHAYTRFLLPLLTQTDVDYYKYKGLLNKDFKLESDAKVIQEMIDAIQYFHDYANKSLVKRHPDADTNPLKNNTYVPDRDNFKTIKDVPFNDVYEEFLLHYLYTDTTRYLADLAKEPDNEDEHLSLFLTYTTIRHVYRSFALAVIAQLKCVKAIVEQFPFRREGKRDTKRVLDKAASKCIYSPEAYNKAYVVSEETLRLLYDYYFERKESRQRYTLPLSPIPFPICKHKEPSPIDINTKKGRKSTLTTYKFGQAGYRLNRFFMMFPNDGSTLLSVGIVGGERVDDSSVKLTGGAVKGNHLTFQTMLIRIARDWKSTGSEHQFNGIGAQMELQMIFTIAGSADRIKYWHVLARVQNRLFQFREKLVIILSVLVDVLESEEEVIRRIESEGTLQDPYLFEPFTQVSYLFRKEREEHSEDDEPRGYVSVDPVFRFIDFIPKKRSKFYTYRGSLSWPPCFGYVIWSIYEQRLYISKRQFDEFIKIPAFGMADHNRASENFRLMSQIYVEEEHAPNLDFVEREKLVAKRTVDRNILVGFHDPNPDANEALVNEAVYYLDSDNAAAQVKGGSCAAATVTLTLFSKYLMKM